MTAMTTFPPCDHIWVEGAQPQTIGQRIVIYCSLCGVVRPRAGEIFVGPIQTTLDGWQTFLAAKDSLEGVFL